MNYLYLRIWLTLLKNARRIELIKRASKWKHCRSKEHLRRIVNKELHIPNEPLQIDLKGLDCIEDIILTIGKQTFHLLKKKN